MLHASPPDCLIDLSAARPSHKQGCQLRVPHLAAFNWRASKQRFYPEHCQTIAPESLPMSFAYSPNWRIIMLGHENDKEPLKCP